ncbi:Outer membrane protein beta-barrel family protein [Filimonas lacunae]|uniref:Outer membrane protein beta-barrel family protein n=1 Tax=Filimonas lacunae TaxID=477680 RepID=A0A173M9Q7_9BACT|nr:TonB-dependent receptor [Filimonas lacunae]BAV04208.1 hypothetical protein FLA_0187 [Filimonas lacunae]SIT14195.1 Outer membrane protein beta-barrel family protein [Filimonas lacunae]
MGYSQQAVVHGNIADSFAHKKMYQSSVALLRAKDSVLYRFTRTTSDGNFTFSRLTAGDYILLVTTPGYADYVDRLQLTDTTQLHKGQLFMTLKARLLEDVVVRQTVAAIKIKGDTTEYTADSFHTVKDATVEDLLKKLPGIQVNSKGQITAQGETVKKVLVDGEEFFGDDPTLVTKNLRADMIDKVQVYDKKSDQAAFTGVDDGTKDKTINLKLKADKKKGYFGKLEASAGSEGYYDYQAMFNLFRNKEKLAAYGIVSSIGKTGLNWDEKSSYGQSQMDNVNYDEVMGFYSFNGDGDDIGGWDGRYNERGYPYATAAGLHYNNKWKEDKISLNANYKMLDLKVNSASDNQSKMLLRDSAYYQNSGDRSTNNVSRHRLDGSYEVKIDSSSVIKFTANGGTDHKVTENYSYTNSLDSSRVLVNEGNTHRTSVGDTRKLSANLLWMKKLAKKGRSLSVNLSGKINNTDASGFLDATTNYYKEGVFSYNQLVNQLKTQQVKNTSIDAKATYAEPLSKTSALVFNYGVVINNTQSQRNSFNTSGDGKYNQLDSTYSSNYIYDIFTHQGGATYTMSLAKLKMKVGSNVGITNFNQQDKLFNTEQTRHFINWYPSAMMRYSFSTQRSLSFQYNGHTTQPSIEALQPLRTNENPLSITIGNPDLKPEFSNQFNLYFNDYKVMSKQSLWVSLSYNVAQNSISSRSVIDSAGKTTSQSVNVNGNSYAGLYANYGFKLAKPDISIRPGINFSMQKNSNFVNGLANQTRGYNYEGGVYIGRDKEEKYDIGVNLRASYSTSRSSIQQNVQPDYWTYYIQPEATLLFPGKLELHTDGNFTLRQRTSIFTTNNNIFLWNAWIGKKLLKNKSLLLKASVNDILNQNTGFSRNIYNNNISQSTYNTIRRYGMLSVVWNFNGTTVKE